MAAERVGDARSDREKYELLGGTRDQVERDRIPSPVTQLARRPVQLERGERQPEPEIELPEEVEPEQLEERVPQVVELEHVKDLRPLASRRQSQLAGVP